MLAAPAIWRPCTWPENTDTMTTRTATLVTIGLIACLLVGVAMAALYAGDISERSLSIVTSILGTLATVLAGLLLFLRVETVNSKVETVDSKVDEAATKAATAVAKTAIVERKVEQVHHDLLNGGLRDNVKRAMLEAEGDPDLLAQRIETIAKGVQKDRHDKQNREAGLLGRAQIDERIRRRADEKKP
jgi:hypothetical protein